MAELPKLIIPITLSFEGEPTLWHPIKRRRYRALVRAIIVSLHMGLPTPMDPRDFPEHTEHPFDWESELS